MGSVTSAGNLQASAFSTAERFSALLGIFCQAIMGKKFRCPAVAFLAVNRQGFEDRLQILPDRQSPKITAVLRQISDTESGSFIHGHACDVGGVEGDRSAVRRNHAEDHAKRGGFSRAVATEHANDFPLGQDEADFVDHGATVISFYQLCGFEQIHSLPGKVRRKLVWTSNQ